MRIDKEMAKIRKAFKDSRSLGPYQKKKYVWKMLYMFILGYEIDFGHMEALSLISGTTWSEKQVVSLTLHFEIMTTQRGISLAHSC